MKNSLKHKKFELEEIEMIIIWTFILLGACFHLFYSDKENSYFVPLVGIFCYLILSRIIKYLKYVEKISKYQDGKLLEVERKINIFFLMFSVAFLLMSILMISTVISNTGNFIFLVGMLPTVYVFSLIYIFRKRIIINDKEIVLFRKNDDRFEIINWTDVERVKFAETQDVIILFLKTKERRVFKKRIMEDDEWSEFVEVFNNKR